MKITLQIDDLLLSRAKAHAKRTGRPLNALVEDGLRLVRPADAARQEYTLPDMSVGNPDGRDPLEAHSWQDMRELMHGDRQARW